MQKNNQTTIEEIFRICRGGDNRTGVELLYRDYYRTMYGIAFSILKKNDASEDVIHNVVYKLLRLDSTKFPSQHELSWLYTVMKNEALMFLRSAPVLECIDENTLVIEEDKNIRDLVDMDSYQQMISRLNDTQRQVVTLKVLGGCTHREIANMLGKPVGTVQWIYHSAVNKLKVILSGLSALTVFALGKCVSKIVAYIKYDPPIIQGEAVISRHQFVEDIVFYGVLAVVFAAVKVIDYKKLKKI